MSDDDEQKKRTFRAPPRVPRLRKKRGGGKSECRRRLETGGARPARVANMEGVIRGLEHTTRGGCACILIPGYRAQYGCLIL